MKYSKIRKFIKDDKQFKDVYDTLLAYYPKIFEVYLY